MAILRRPGSIVRCHLPSENGAPAAEKIVANIRVMTEAMSNEIEEITKQGYSNFEVARRVIGLQVDSLENLELPTGEAFELKKDTRGYLERETCEWLIPYHNELVTLCMAVGTIDEVDAKNS